jgi:hypothetical protein
LWNNFSVVLSRYSCLGSYRVVHVAPVEVDEMHQSRVVVALGLMVSAIAVAVSGVAWASGQAAHETTLVGHDTATRDALGFSVAVSGSIAVVGAQDHAGHGAAYVFAKSGAAWREQAELRGSDTAPGDSFGYSVGVSGHTVVIGAPGHHGGGVTGAGYIFTESGKKWVQTFEARTRGVGESVAIDGTTAAFGSGNNTGTGIGAVLLYVKSGSTWVHQATVKSGVPADAFGSSVSLSGNELAIGANFGGNAVGHVYVYGRTGASWRRQAVLVGSNTTAADDFAQSVALSGTALIVGSPLHNNGDGAAYVFVMAGHGWSQQAKLTESSPSPGDMFGWAVGLSGSEAVAGAYQRSGTGAAFTFLRHGSVWSHDQMQIASRSVIGDEVGWSVAQSKTTSVIGAQSASNGSGAAYVFGG